MSNRRGEQRAAYLRVYGPEYRRQNRDALLAQARQKYGDRRQFLDRYKDRPCADCGEKHPPCVMDFDHVRGKKVFGIGGGMAGRSLDTIRREIAKCDVVCANCHRLRTHQKGEKL